MVYLTRQDQPIHQPHHRLLALPQKIQSPAPHKTHTTPGVLPRLRLGGRAPLPPRPHARLQRAQRRAVLAAQGLDPHHAARGPAERRGGAWGGGRGAGWLCREREGEAFHHPPIPTHNHTQPDILQNRWTPPWPPSPSPAQGPCSASSCVRRWWRAPPSWPRAACIGSCWGGCCGRRWVRNCWWCV